LACGCPTPVNRRTKQRTNRYRNPGDSNCARVERFRKFVPHRRTIDNRRLVHRSSSPFHIPRIVVVPRLSSTTIAFTRSYCWDVYNFYVVDRRDSAIGERVRIYLKKNRVVTTRILGYIENSDWKYRRRFVLFVSFLTNLRLGQ